MRNAGLAVMAFAWTFVAALSAQSPGARPIEAQITNQPPSALKPATGLSDQARRDNFEALWTAIDITYAHFALKSIDWNAIGQRYRARLDEVVSDDEFYGLLFRMVNELKDTHSWLQNYREPPLPAVASVAVDAFEGRPFVVAVAAGSDAEQAGVKPGWEVTAVDGLAAADKVEALRPLLRGFSSERAFRREAARLLLAGEKATPATIELRMPDGGSKTVTLKRTPGQPLRRPSTTAVSGLTRTANLQYGILPSGLGYIRIVSFESRDELDREFDAALDAVRRTPGLVLDIRDNPGGFGHSWIVGRLLRKRTKTIVSFTKAGSAHDALTRRAAESSPAGPWQYAGPIALLVNDVTGSASDLFAAQLRSAGRVTIVGSTTHGNLSGTAAFVILPCGLVVRISNGYVADAQGRPVEVNGNVPDVVVEPTIDDFLSGRDPVLERAVGVLTRRR